MRVSSQHTRNHTGRDSLGGMINEGTPVSLVLLLRNSVVRGQILDQRVLHGEKRM